MPELTRTQFLRLLGTSAGAAAGISAVPGCGGDDDDGSVEPIDQTSAAGGSRATGAGGSPAVGGSGGADAGGADVGGSGGASGGSGGDTVGACETDVELVNAHVHDVSVPADDVNAGEAMTYELSTVAGHTHSIELTADDLAMLAGGATIEVESTVNSGHSHTVSVTCS